MQFTEIPLKGAYIIDMEKREDERGFFGRFFCTDEFKKMGLETEIIQCNNSLSKFKGTLRGMHYQLKPFEEVKLVRCIKGEVFDVILDLRKDSTTFGQWFSENLSAENRLMLYVPRGFAHGFLTLTDDAELLYMTTNQYSPEKEKGIRWNDERFGIHWPIAPTVLSEKDSSHPNFSPSHHLDI